MEDNPKQTTTQCIWCLSEIPAAARVCRYCGREQKEPQPLYGVLGLVLVIIGFMLFAFMGRFTTFSVLLLAAGSIFLIWSPWRSSGR